MRKRLAVLLALVGLLLGACAGPSPSSSSVSTRTYDPQECKDIAQGYIGGRISGPTFDLLMDAANCPP